MSTDPRAPTAPATIEPSERDLHIIDALLQAEYSHEDILELVAPTECDTDEGINWPDVIETRSKSWDEHFAREKQRRQEEKQLRSDAVEYLRGAQQRAISSTVIANLNQVHTILRKLGFPA